MPGKTNTRQYVVEDASVHLANTGTTWRGFFVLGVASRDPLLEPISRHQTSHLYACPACSRVWLTLHGCVWSRTRNPDRTNDIDTPHHDDHLHPSDRPADEYTQARALWRDAGLTTYRYTFEDDCGECAPPGPIAVTVWEGLVSRLDVATIEQIFDAIDSAINEDIPIEVSYDPQFGYPTDVWIDREARAYDGGTHWLVHGFEPGLPRDSASHDALLQAGGVWDLNRPDAYE